MLIFGYEVEVDAHILVTASASASDFTRVARPDDAKIIRKAIADLDRVGGNANEALTFREALTGARPAALNR